MFTPIESDAIVLRVATEALNACVNHALLQLSRSGREVFFQSSDHQKLFAIRLLDFLEKVDSKLTGASGSSVDTLKLVVEHASFAPPGDVAVLNKPLSALSNWLDHEIVVDVWFPSLDYEGTLRIRREDMLYMTGNISKHNLARLTGVSKRLQTIFERNQEPIELLEAAVALEDFYGRFQHDILVYYANWLVELLNNLRWGIHDYLTPEFRRSYTPHPDDPPRYSFDYPEGVENPFARTCYWDLMNLVRSKPYFPRFEADDIWKRDEFRY